LLAAERDVLERAALVVEVRDLVEESAVCALLARVRREVDVAAASAEHGGRDARELHGDRAELVAVERLLAEIEGVAEVPLIAPRAHGLTSLLVSGTLAGPLGEAPSEEKIIALVGAINWEGLRG